VYINYPNVEVFIPRDGGDLRSLLNDEIPKRLMEIKYDM
jgi:hypothetical protein